MIDPALEARTRCVACQVEPALPDRTVCQDCLDMLRIVGDAGSIGTNAAINRSMLLRRLRRQVEQLRKWDAGEVRLTGYRRGVLRFSPLKAGEQEGEPRAH